MSTFRKLNVYILMLFLIISVEGNSCDCNGLASQLETQQNFCRELSTQFQRFQDKFKNTMEAFEKSLKDQEDKFEKRIVEDKENLAKLLQDQQTSFALMLNHLKDNYNPLDDITKGIEEDVQQNTQDIEELSIEFYQQQFVHNEDNRSLIGKLSDINSTFEEKVNKINSTLFEEVDRINSFLIDTQPPTGSIIAWVPSYSLAKNIPNGWQRCDGSVIEDGPLAGKTTPDLNRSRRFLRGTTDESAERYEDDDLENHEHLDSGHSHQDKGHSHQDDGHRHILNEEWDSGSQIFSHESPDDHSKICKGGCINSNSVHGKWHESIPTGYASITTNSANIQSSFSGLSGVDSGKEGKETRPVNMSVVWIIRIL